jgi:hypothetical protein
LKPNRSGEKELKEKLEVATAAHGKALTRFRAVLRDIPGGFSHPDGSERILMASQQELKQAHRGVIAALSALKRTSAAGVRKKKPI